MTTTYVVSYHLDIACRSLRNMSRHSLFPQSYKSVADYHLFLANLYARELKDNEKEKACLMIDALKKIHGI